MATILKEATLMIGDEVKEVIPVSNPCQMWRNIYNWYDKYGDGLRVIVPTADGQPFKDFTARRLSNGKRALMNSVKETNRAYIKAHKPDPTPINEEADATLDGTD